MKEEIPPQALRRIPTGIAGFDTICGGGPLEGGLYLLIGAPGTGKTVLANHMCFAHVRAAAAGGAPRRALYVTLLAESHGRMMAHLSPFSFFASHVVGNELVYVGAYKTLEAEGLKGLLDLVRTMVRDMQASLLVLDGLVSAGAVAASQLEFKRFIHQLGVFAHGERCMTWVLSSAADQSHSEPEYTMVDGIVELLVQQGHVRTARELAVRKLRGVEFLEGRHTMAITSDGIVVHPRLEGLVSRSCVPPPDAATHDSVGIAELDRMLGGGVLTGSTTMVLGASGTGKTSLALHFLCGGRDPNERAVFFGFYESPARLVGKAEQLGMRLRARVDSGRVQILWRLPIESRLDELAATLLSAVDTLGARRAVIDGLGGFSEAAFYPPRALGFITALLGALRARNVTTLATLETAAVATYAPEPMLAVSPLVENVIVLRAEEDLHGLTRFVAIRKVREGDFDASTREFEISSKGVLLKDRVRPPS